VKEGDILSTKEQMHQQDLEHSAILDVHAVDSEKKSLT
jgi:hypothetical protein